MPRRTRGKTWYEAVADLVTLGCSLRQAVDAVVVHREGVRPGTWGRMRDVGEGAVTNSLREVDRELGDETVEEDVLPSGQVTLDDDVVEALEDAAATDGGRNQ